MSGIRKKILFPLIAALLPVVLIFICGEIYFRIFPAAIKDPVPPPPWNYRILDETFGWLNKPNYHYQGTMKDLSGATYPVQINFDSHGFRGNQPHDRPGAPVIFFVGDSYTQSIEVSDDKVFYHLIADTLGCNVYAFGAAGYGTLQELMILKKYFDAIKPDVVVLQMCSNDCSDNDCVLETRTNYKVGQRRPYLNAQGRIYYDHPWMRHKHLREYSYFLYYLAEKLDRLSEESSGKPRVYEGERRIVEEDTMYAPFRNSLAETDRVLKQMKTFLQDKTQLMAFVSDHYRPAVSRLEALCLRNHIELAEGVGQTVQDHQVHGEVVHAADGFHWNENGHRIVADTLCGKLRQMLPAAKH